MPKLEDDIDALFQLPLDQFIEGRKLLAAQLKKTGQRAEAERVKLLTKPPISAWTVNQLYWDHREPFDELMASGQRFRKAQASGKIAEMRDALNARTEALKELSDLATTLLGDADHNASLDTIRRVTSTLEALSAYALLPDATLGRLTKDIDPPGFESSFTGTSFSGTAGASPANSKSKAQSPKTKAPSPKSKSETLEKKDPSDKVRQAKLAAAKVSLQNAKKSLTLAQAKAQSLESQQNKADAAVKDTAKEQREAEKERREVEVRFKRATSAAEAAARRAQTIREEVEATKQTLHDAQRAVEKSTKELESLFRSPK